MMRYRVDTLYGYASFHSSEEAKARECYEREGLRLRHCVDIYDDGVVIEGLPLNVSIKNRAQT